MNVIEPGYAWDITPNPVGATRIQVCHPYPHCPPLQGPAIPDDRGDDTRDAISTGV